MNQELINAFLGKSARKGGLNVKDLKDLLKDAGYTKPRSKLKRAELLIELREYYLDEYEESLKEQGNLKLACEGKTKKKGGMTVKELKELAKLKGVSVTGLKKREMLLKLCPKEGVPAVAEKKEIKGLTKKEIWGRFKPACDGKTRKEGGLNVADLKKLLTYFKHGKKLSKMKRVDVLNILCSKIDTVEEYLVGSLSRINQGSILDLLEREHKTLCIKDLLTQEEVDEDLEKKTLDAYFQELEDCKSNVIIIPYVLVDSDENDRFMHLRFNKNKGIVDNVSLFGPDKTGDFKEAQEVFNETFVTSLQNYFEIVKEKEKYVVQYFDPPYDGDFEEKLEAFLKAKGIDIVEYTIVFEMYKTILMLRFPTITHEKIMEKANKEMLNENFVETWYNDYLDKIEGYYI